MKILLILAIAYCVLLFIVWAIGMVRYKKFSIAIKVLTWSVLVTFILAALSKFFAVKYKHNAPIIHLECITGYIFYGLTYYYLFKNAIIKKVIFISIIVVSVFFIFNAIFLQHFASENPTNIFIPTNILFVIFSLLLFKEMLLYPLNSNITKQSIFWYNTGIFFYSTSMSLILGLANYIAKHNIRDEFTSYLWYLILFVFHILIAVALLTDNKETTGTHG